MRSRLRRKGSNRGFSVAEVLVALSLLGSGVTMMLGIFPASVVGISDARNIHLATELAQAKLEYWMNQGYSTVVAEPATIEKGTSNLAGSDSNSQSKFNAGTSNQQQSFTYQVTHSTVVSGGDEQIDVLVSWTQHTAPGSSALKSVHLTAWLAAQ